MILVFVVTACVRVVHIETNARTFVDVGRKARNKVVITVGLAARGVII